MTYLVKVSWYTVEYYFRSQVRARMDYKYCTNRFSNRNHTVMVF